MHRPVRTLHVVCALALPFLAASCRDSTGPRQVATLAVRGAPSGPLLVGSTLQLQATPLDAHGDSLSGRALTWSSTDSSVATVSPLGVVTGVGAGTATVRVSSGAQSDTIPFDFRVGAVVGPAGGRIALFGDSLTLDVPKEALTRTTTLLLRAAARATDPHIVGTAYELAPATVVFANAASLTLRYDPARIPAGVAQGGLTLAVSSGSGWYPVTGSTVDTSSRTVTGPIAHAASYAVMWASVDSVAIIGAQSPDSLYVGETAHLTALPYDSSHDFLPLQPTAWSSSNPGVATVDSTGQIAALGVGAATITATIEGHTASVAVAVLGGLVVDWSRATDWTTYQGDARHDGYVPATMNPRRFRQLWTVVPFASTPPNAVAAGDSSVVVTSGGMGYQMQRIVVLDAATGRSRWHYDFGAITDMGPAAYVDGTAYVVTAGPDSLYLWSFDASTGVIHFRVADGGAYSWNQAPTAVGQSVYASNAFGISAFSTVGGVRQWFTPATPAPVQVPTPAVGGGGIYAWAGGTATGLTALDTAGGVTYTIPDSGFAYDSYGAANEVPVLGGANDLLVTNGAGLLSLDLIGRKIAWQVPGSFGLGPAVAAGVLYVVNSGHVEARSESDGSLLWTFVPPDGTPVAHPCVVSDNILFVSTNLTTYAVDLASHAPVWSQGPGGSLAISKAGVLFISSRTNGSVTAIALK